LTLLRRDHYYARSFSKIELMPIYDVSVPLSAATPTYPGDPGIEINQFLSLTNGNAANVSLLHFGAHSGTHVDAPAHFIADGARADSIPLQTLIGVAEVIEVPPAVKVIDGGFISESCQRREERVLFKTRNSSFWSDNASGFRSDYTSLDVSAAERLIDLGVKLVGIDYLSIEAYGSETFATHHVLLGKNVVIVEGLDLRTIVPGRYEFICLPLRLAGGSGDGAPARAVLRTLPTN
jgi:arylformamidase